MGEDPVDDLLLFDASDYLDGPTTARACLYVNVEHALEPLCPGHCRMVFGGCLFVSFFFAFSPFATFSWGDQSPPAMIRGKDSTPIILERVS